MVLYSWFTYLELYAKCRHFNMMWWKYHIWGIFVIIKSAQDKQLRSTKLSIVYHTVAELFYFLKIWGRNFEILESLEKKIGS